MRVSNDHDPAGDDCECTFFWMNVDRAPEDEWIRLSDFAFGDMDNFNVNERIGFRFNAVFDFFVADRQPFTIRANGYDGGVTDRAGSRDCFDNHFGHHRPGAHISFEIDVFPPTFRFIHPCYRRARNDGAQVPENDPFGEISRTFSPADNYGLGPRQHILSSRRIHTASVDRDFDLVVRIEEIQ
jgi:hypothetical protein